MQLYCTIGGKNQEAACELVGWLKRKCVAGWRASRLSQQQLLQTRNPYWTSPERKVFSLPLDIMLVFHSKTTFYSGNVTFLGQYFTTFISQWNRKVVSYVHTAVQPEEWQKRTAVQHCFLLHTARIRPHHTQRNKVGLKLERTSISFWLQIGRIDARKTFKHRRAQMQSLVVKMMKLTWDV